MGYTYVEHHDISLIDEKQRNALGESEIVKKVVRTESNVEWDRTSKIGYKDQPEWLKIYAGDAIVNYSYGFGELHDVKIGREETPYDELDLGGQIERTLEDKAKADYKKILDAETDKAISYVTARRIAKCRKRKRLTKQAVADILGVTLGAYNAYELAYVKVHENTNHEENYKALDSKLAFRVPPVPKLIQLAKEFDCSVEWLIGVSDDSSKRFSDYNIEPIYSEQEPAEPAKAQDQIPAPMPAPTPAPVAQEVVKPVSPIFQSFAANFDSLSVAQQGMLYGKLCEMLHETGVEMK